MSWIDKVKNNLIITTPDQVPFNFSLWVDPILEMEWNATEFNFIGTAGTLVKKQKEMGKKYALTFYLQGENHLDQRDNFIKRLSDERPCEMNHPFYGIIIIQILRLRVDNAESLNYTKFTCEAYETIEGTNISAFSSVQEEIFGKFNEVNETLANDTLTATPNTQDINRTKKSMQQNYAQAIKIATVPEQAQEYFNAFNNANTAINNIIATPVLAVQTVTAMITLPAKFEASVRARLGAFRLQLDTLRRNLEGIKSLPARRSVASKQLYEMQSISIISAMCIASITPLEPVVTGSLSPDYTNSSSVLDVINIVKLAYSDYQADMDSLQDPNGSDPNYYVPSYQAAQSLDSMVKLTLANLFSIALNGKREVQEVLMEDSNIILLTDKYYGLDLDDVNIQLFQDTNGLKSRHTLQIKKNETVRYFI